MQLTADRFWKHVYKTDGCWLWTASCSTPGYGQFKVGDRPRLAHRIAWWLTYGYLPPKHLEVNHVCHSVDRTCPGGPCIHRRCVRPDHLQLTTHRSNIISGRTGDRDKCIHGHPYTPENTNINAKGARHCRTCSRERAKRHYALVK